MDNRTFSIHVNGHKGIVDRVSKTTARKLYDSGKTVFLLGHKLWIGMMYQPCPINQSDRFGDNSFDCNCNEFAWYNCDYERGYYPAFYVLQGDK